MMKNFWDYSLLANPFNPATPVANAPPNFNPLVKCVFQCFGDHYRRNFPSLRSTIREETCRTTASRFYPIPRSGCAPVTTSIPTVGHPSRRFIKARNNSCYRIFPQRSPSIGVGVDFRFLPRTNISYDQIWSYYKTDPGLTDENQQFSVGSGFPAGRSGCFLESSEPAVQPHFSGRQYREPKMQRVL